MPMAPDAASTISDSTAVYTPGSSVTSAGGDTIEHRSGGHPGPHFAAIRACGAACFMRVSNQRNWTDDLFLAGLDDLEQLRIVQGLSRLLDHGPGHVGQARQQVQVLEVAQEPEWS